MKEWLVVATEFSITVIDALALIIIVIGTLEAAVKSVPMMFSSPSAHERRDVWLRFSRWLVAGLTFQLADIIETSIAPDWDDVGRLAAIAIIRTFLNYFLEKDLNDLRERQTQDAAPTARKS